MDTPELQSPPISDEEIEQLLQQAESLVDEIADETSAELVELAPPAADILHSSATDASLSPGSPGDASWSAPAPIQEDDASGTPFPTKLDIDLPAAEPLEAIAQTGAIADEMTAILNDAAIADSTDPAPATGTPKGEPIAEQAIAPPPPMPETVLLPVRALNSVRPDSPVAGLSEIAPREEKATVADAPSSNDSTAPSVGRPAGARFRARLAATGRGVVFILGAVPIAIVNLLLRLIVLLDRPFARFSVESKLHIGLVALVTLFMGAAAWVLPRIASHNPYALIGP
jgi:hypothetical protein